MDAPLHIFIVDDDPDYADLVHYQIRRHIQPEPVVHRFNTGEAALEALHLNPDLVLLDLVMPGQGGLETLRQMAAAKPGLPIVMVSAQSVVRIALEAVKLGAYDYVTKGHDDTIKLQTIIRHIAERIGLSRKVAMLRDQLPGPQGLDGILGESAAMADVFRLVNKTLRGDLTVAILGESGTGKELIAQAIHYQSPRKRGPFVVVNCAAIPHELMESEFFGHEKGSFTGAYTRKMGKFEQAHGGTIFLDEIGELDPSLQAKLLRVLQNQEVQRIGGNETIQVDVRVLSATNQDIAAMIKDGRFREDLYYRLFQFPLHLPPLRERDQDTLLLAEYFRKTYLQKHPDLGARRLSRRTRQVMLQYTWPGNVRELKNTVERALLISDTAEVQPEDLMLDQAMPRPLSVGEMAHQTFASVAAASAPLVATESTVYAHAPEPLPSERTATDDPVYAVHTATDPDQILPLEEVKKIAVAHAYRVCQGNINRMAERLQVTRSTIYRLMKKHEIGSEA